MTLVGGQSPLRLTTDPAEDAFPCWSPDGKRIAFIRRRAGTSAEIMLVSATGGPESKLREIRLSHWVTSRALVWTADGKWLCFTNEIGTAGHHALFLLSPDSNLTRRLLPEEDNGIGDVSPAFSPDGRWLAFARFQHPFNSKLLLQRLSSDFRPQGTPMVVEDAGINPKAPVWTVDKKILFIDRMRILEAEIGRPARPFYVSASDFCELAVAASAQRLVACLKNQRGEIWTIPLDAGGLKARGDARRILQSSAGQNHARYSPDGRSLAFTSTRSGSSEVWLADSDGRNPRQLTQLKSYIAGWVRWSPDGRALVFHARLPTEPQLFTVSVPDGSARQMTHGKPGFTAPSWSMDGRSLYAETLENGKSRTYRIPVASGTPEYLFEGSEPVEVPGRGLLVYSKQDQPGIYARSLSGNTAQNPEHLLVADFQPPHGGLYPVEDGLYYVGATSTGIARAIRFYRFDKRGSVDIAPAPSSVSGGLTVTPDRTRLAYGAAAQGSEDLVQIELK